MLDSILLQTGTSISIGDAVIVSSPIWIAIIAILVIIFKFGDSIKKTLGFVREEKKNIKTSKEQKRVKKQLTKKVNTLRGELNKQLGFNAFPYDLDIDWTDIDHPVSDLREDERKVIVILQDENVNPETFASVFYAYSKKGLLPRTKPYMPTRMSNVVDLTMTKKFLRSKKPDAIEFFEDEILKDTIHKDNQIKEYFEGLSTLDDRGLFTRIFLKELHYFGLKMHGTISNKFLEEESLEFLKYFSEIGHRRDKEPLPHKAIKGRHLRSAVVLIADEDIHYNFNRYALKPAKTPHAKHIQKLIDDNIESIWLLGRAKKNVAYTKILLNYFQGQKKVNNVKHEEYNHPYDQTPTIVGYIRLQGILE